MRVTESLVFHNATRDTASAREAADRASIELSRGTRVEHPGDDPGAAGLVVAYRMSTDRFDAIDAATQAASRELEASDSALGDISTALSRARELAMQFSSAGYSQTNASGAAAEVDGLMAQIASALNTRVGNRYVFGGSQDAAPPFDASGNYSGDDIARNVEIAPGVYQQANVLVGSMARTADPTQQTVFNTLTALRDALRTYSSTGVQATLDGLQQGIDDVSVARGEAGASMSAFDAASSAAQTASDQGTKSAGKLTDVDVSEAAVKLQATRTALEATYAAVSKSFQLSILNYLK